MLLNLMKITECFFPKLAEFLSSDMHGASLKLKHHTANKTYKGQGGVVGSAYNI